MALELQNVAVYAAAALAEIGGCFAFRAWLRMGRSAPWLVPGAASLALFACLPTLAGSSAAGRAYAAYGGVYVAALAPGRGGPAAGSLGRRWRAPVPAGRRRHPPRFETGLTLRDASPAASA